MSGEYVSPYAVLAESCRDVAYSSARVGLITVPTPEGGREPTVTALARAKCPAAFAKRPRGRVAALVWDALVGLPNPPTRRSIAHWTDLSADQIDRALDRLRANGQAAEAGWVPNGATGQRVQTFRAVVHA